MRQNPPVETPPPALVGRAREREAIAAALQALVAGREGIVAVEGEPGIGKSRLLAHLTATAAAARCLVLEARASEFETDLPYALFAEALRSTGGLPRIVGDRHAMHAAVRDLLGAMAGVAGSAPLVICLDDVQWADPASSDLLATLVRREHEVPVLLAVAARSGQLPAPVAAALGAALREDRVTQLLLEPLTAAEAVELVGEVGAAIYADTGGNPFYLEQLARAAPEARPSAAPPGDGSVPPAVAAALAGELAGLTPAARRLLDAAAVTGDPFEPGLAGEVAELADDAARDAIDELVDRGLLRAATVPGRFAFRHPIVRHAVYVAAPSGWRLGAHARASEALGRSGAGPVRRAHHVEVSAQTGDETAIELLDAAATELQAPAPATAARFQAAALRLLPDRAGLHPRRARMAARLADAQAAAGDAEAARVTLVAALRTAPDDDRLALTVALANQEWWLGGHEGARRRLQVALADLPARPSPDRIRLRLALGLMALLACDLDDALAETGDARDDARSIGDPVFELAALAGGAVASVLAAHPDGPQRLAESAAALERLTPDQLATRLPALWMHGRAYRVLGRFDEARSSLRRGALIAAETGRERLMLMLMAEGALTLVERGALMEAVETGEDAVDRARFSGNQRMLLWALSALSTARLAEGDVSAALRHAGEAAALEIRPDVHAAGQPGWALGAALTAAGNADQAVAAMLGSFGGADLPDVMPGERPAAAADLVEAQLARGDVAAAQAALAQGEAAAARAGTPWAAAVTGVARSAVLLARGEAEAAAAAAAEAWQSAVDAPLLSARAQLAEGRALAAADDRPLAIETLIAAESALDAMGAMRLRDQAVRELRRLGHRVVRPAGETPGGALGALTARQRDIALLVAQGRTNREVAEQLVLSTRTVEAHLRSIYATLEVRSRTELAHALQGGQNW